MNEKTPEEYMEDIARYHLEDHMNLMERTIPMKFPNSHENGHPTDKEFPGEN